MMPYRMVVGPDGEMLRDFEEHGPPEPKVELTWYTSIADVPYEPARQMAEAQVVEIAKTLRRLRAYFAGCPDVFTNLGGPECPYFLCKVEHEDDYADDGNTRVNGIRVVFGWAMTIGGGHGEDMFKTENGRFAIAQMWNGHLYNSLQFSLEIKFRQRDMRVSSVSTRCDVIGEDRSRRDNPDNVFLLGSNHVRIENAERFHPQSLHAHEFVEVVRAIQRMIDRGEIRRKVERIYTEVE